MRLLGSGGYSDVFLYTQEDFGRDVAIKVLLSGVESDQGRRQFLAEARAMAALSAHPAIVTIYGADISDDGRPYLVMEYYPRDDLWRQCRAGPLHTASALRIGVQLAGAVETAHRAGILHRDIKPANVLVSGYGRPGLTDFGIAAPRESAASDDDGGLSVPWAPPEAFAAPTDDVRSDVYSLAATVYSLLAGRSPFQYDDSRPSTAALMRRIERDEVPPVGRSDMPVSLQRLLAAALAKQVGDRPPSAAAFARGLQAVEVEMQLPVTDLDVPDEMAARVRHEGAEAAEVTRLRGNTSVEAQPARLPPPDARASAPPSPPPEDLTGGELTARPRHVPAFPPSFAAPVPQTAPTNVRPAMVQQVESATEAPVAPGRRSVRRLIAGPAAVTVVGVALALARQASAPTAPAEDVPDPGAVTTVIGLPTPRDVAIRVRGSQAMVTWDVAGLEQNDAFLISAQTDAGEVDVIEAEASPATIPVTPGEETCVVVTLLRDGVPSAESAPPACAGPT